jgi:hypothetical protein
MSTGPANVLAERPACTHVAHPTATPSMHTHDPHPEALSHSTLSWAFDDEDAPTELTIFDPENEITTRWITIDKDYTYTLSECV